MILIQSLKEKAAEIEGDIEWEEGAYARSLLIAHRNTILLVMSTLEAKQ